MSHIYFVPSTTAATVDAVIYSDSGRKLATHTMTLDGAAIRMHDMQAAIRDGKRHLRKRTNALSARIRRERQS